jgi:hypothetical protein
VSEGTDRSDAQFRSRLEDVGIELERATTRWTHKRRRRRQSLAAACAALIIVAGAITASTELGSNGVEPAAAQVFERAAQADASRAKPRRGRYFYTETVVTTRSQNGAVSTQRTELWASADGSGVQLAHPREVESAPEKSVPAAPPQGTTGPTGATGPTAPPSQPTASLPDATSSPKKQRGRGGRRVERYRRGTIAPGELGSFDTAFRDGLLAQLQLRARQLEELSSSESRFNLQLLNGARRIARRLEPSGGPDADAVDRQAFFLVAGLLGQWGEPMPDRLRRALYRFAGTLGGIKVDENFQDARGDAAIALSSGGARIVLSPKTYRLRATSYTVGKLETTIATVRTAVVDRPRERPAR